MATRAEADWANALALYYAARQAYHMALLSYIDRGCSMQRAHRKTRRQREARDRALAQLRNLSQHREIGVCEL